MNPDEIQTCLEELREKSAEIADRVKRDREMAEIMRIAKTYNGEDKIVSSEDIANDLLTRAPILTIPVGIKALDDILGGFVRKQLIVIAAPTKMGKTSFCIDLTARMKELSPLWFPFEEPAEELIQKFLVRKEKPPLFFTPQKIIGNTLKWIERKIIEAKVKYGSEVIFLDHLHFIVPFSMERQDLRIGETMRELKGLAKRLNVIIFLIAHLKKTKMDQNPDLEDLRDSSFIAQEADTVIMLWRKTHREQGEIVITNEVNISVQANRRTGKTGNVKMIFENGRFIELSKRQDEELDRFIGKPSKHDRDTSW